MRGAARRRDGERRRSAAGARRRAPAWTACSRSPARLHSYVAWVRRLGVFGEEGVEYFSRTTDGRRSWSDPRAITPPTPGTLPDPTIVDVHPDGTLINFFLLAKATPFLPPGVPRVPWEVMATRSTDGGKSWSAPVEIGEIDPPSAPEHPESGAIVRAYNVISPDIAPDGTAYVAWNEIDSKDSSRILFSRSRDAGRSWSDPKAIAKVDGQAFIPSLAVASDGTVGVTYYDTRKDKVGDDELTTDLWFSHSHDRGKSWDEKRVAGSFDTLTAPPTGSTGVVGRFLGDYQG